MFKKITKVSMVFALMFTLVAPTLAMANEYEELEGQGTTEADVTPEIMDTPEAEDAPEISVTPEVQDIPEAEDAQEISTTPEAGASEESSTSGEEENTAPDNDEETTSPDDEIDWFEVFHGLQLESIDAVDYVGGHLIDLYAYLLENHLLGFNVWWDAYEALYTQYWDLVIENSSIQGQVIAGTLTHQEGSALLEENIAAMRALVPCMREFNATNPGTCPAQGSGTGSGGGSNSGNNGGNNNNDGGGLRLPQTGIVATHAGLAGAALAGIGAYLKKKQ